MTREELLIVVVALALFALAITIDTLIHKEIQDAGTDQASKRDHRGDH